MNESLTKAKALQQLRCTSSVGVQPPVASQQRRFGPCSLAQVEVLRGGLKRFFATWVMLG